MDTMKKTKEAFPARKAYVPLQTEVIEVRVEKGYATSKLKEEPITIHQWEDSEW